MLNSVTGSSTELQKYNNDNNYTMKQEITSKVNTHVCKIQNNEENIEIKNFGSVEKNKINIQKLKDKAKDLIFLNLIKLLSFYISNLKNKNI